MKRKGLSIVKPHQDKKVHEENDQQDNIQPIQRTELNDVIARVVSRNAQQWHY